jgi:hypothetical protein
MSHQLLPKEEWTKPEDVGMPSSPRLSDTDKAKGHPIPGGADHRDRVRDGRARGPRGHGHPEEAEERRPGQRTLECIYRVGQDQFGAWWVESEGCAIDCTIPTSFVQDSSPSPSPLHLAICFLLLFMCVHVRPKAPTNIRMLATPKCDKKTTSVCSVSSMIMDRRELMPWTLQGLDLDHCPNVGITADCILCHERMVR